jgi:hypothetical protein
MIINIFNIIIYVLIIQLTIWSKYSFIYPNPRIGLYIVYVGLGFTFVYHTYNIYTLKNKTTFN